MTVQAKVFQSAHGSWPPEPVPGPSPQLVAIHSDYTLGWSTAHYTVYLAKSAIPWVRHVGMQSANANKVPEWTEKHKKHSTAPAVRTFSNKALLLEASAIKDFSIVFMRSLEPQIAWEATELSSVTVCRHWAVKCDTNIMPSLHIICFQMIAAITQNMFTDQSDFNRWLISMWLPRSFQNVEITEAFSYLFTSCLVFTFFNFSCSDIVFV